jgi:hypothetical protein
MFMALIDERTFSRGAKKSFELSALSGQQWTPNSPTGNEIFDVLRGYADQSTQTHMFDLTRIDPTADLLFRNAQDLSSLQYGIKALAQ